MWKYNNTNHKYKPPHRFFIPISAHADLVSLFEAEAKVDELETLIISAPEDVAWFEVSVYVAFLVKEG